LNPDGLATNGKHELMLVIATGEIRRKENQFCGVRALWNETPVKLLLVPFPARFP
jgi:hypothetical protein